MPRFLSPFHSSAAIRKSGVLQDPLVAWSPASCASSQHVRKVTSLQDREALWASVVCEMKPDPSVYCPWHTRMVGPAWSLRLRTRSVWLPPLCCILCWALPHTPATKEAQMPHFCVTPGQCCQSTDRIKLPRAQAQSLVRELRFHMPHGTAKKKKRLLGTFKGGTLRATCPESPVSNAWELGKGN